MMLMMWLVAGCLLLGAVPARASPTFGLMPSLQPPQEMVLRRHPTKPWLLMVHDPRHKPSQLHMRPPVRQAMKYHHSPSQHFAMTQAALQSPERPGQFTTDHRHSQSPHFVTMQATQQSLERPVQVATDYRLSPSPHFTMTQAQVAVLQPFERPSVSTTELPSTTSMPESEGSLSEIMLPPKVSASSEYATYNMALVNKSNKRPSFQQQSASQNMYHLRPTSDLMMRQNGFNRFIKNPFYTHVTQPGMIQTTRPTFVQNIPFAVSTVVVKHEGMKEQNHIIANPFKPRGKFNMKGANGFYSSPTSHIPLVDFRPPDVKKFQAVASNGWIPIQSTRRPIITNYHVETHMSTPQLGAESSDVKNEAMHSHNSMGSNNEETTAMNHKPSYNEIQNPAEIRLNQLHNMEKFKQQNTDHLQSTRLTYQPTVQMASQNNFNAYGQKLKQFIHSTEHEEKNTSESTENPIEAFNAEYFLQQNFDEQNNNQNEEIKPTRRSSTMQNQHQQWHSSPMYTDFEDYYDDAPYYSSKRLQNSAMLKARPTNLPTTVRTRNYNFHTNNIPTVKPTLPGSSQSYVMTTVQTQVVHEKDRVNKPYTGRSSFRKTDVNKQQEDPIVVYPVNSTHEPFALSHVTQKTLLVKERLAAKHKPLSSVTQQTKTTSRPDIEIIHSQGQEVHQETTHYHSPVRADANFF